MCKITQARPQGKADQSMGTLGWWDFGRGREDTGHSVPAAASGAARPWGMSLPSALSSVKSQGWQVWLHALALALMCP